MNYKNENKFSGGNIMKEKVVLAYSGGLDTTAIMITRSSAAV